MNVMKFTTAFVVACISLSATAKDYVFDFNNSGELKDWGLTFPQTNLPVPYTLQDGILTITRKPTTIVTSTSILSPYLDLGNKFEIEIRHRMNRKSNLFLPSITLYEESVLNARSYELEKLNSFRIGFPFSSNKPDGASPLFLLPKQEVTPVDYPTVCYREGGDCMKMDAHPRKISSSDLYNKWVTTKIIYNQSRCGNQITKTGYETGFIAQLEYETVGQDWYQGQLVEVQSSDIVQGLVFGQKRSCQAFKPARLVVSVNGSIFDTDSMDIDYIKIRNYF